jgi:hypothetical protein
LTSSSTKPPLTPWPSRVPPRGTLATAGDASASAAMSTKFEIASTSTRGGTIASVPVSSSATGAAIGPAQRLWTLPNNLHYVLANMGVPNDALRAPLPPGGPRALLQHAQYARA